MKKIFFIVFVLINSFLLFAQNNNYNMELFNWNSSKESIKEELTQNGWKLEYNDITNTITASNPKKSVNFCGIKLKSIILFFSVFDDNNSLIGQSYSFENKSDYDSFLDFFIIASKYSIRINDYRLGLEDIRETKFFGYTDTLKVSFYSFDTYDMDKGDYQFVHSVMFSK